MTFVLDDANGNTCAMLTVHMGGPGLALRDENGKVIWMVP